MKHYKLEDLKVGMVVSISQICDIYEVPIVFRKSSMTYPNGDPTGEIIFIGDNYDRVDPSDAVVYKNSIEEDLWLG